MAISDTLKGALSSEKLVFIGVILAAIAVIAASMWLGLFHWLILAAHKRWFLEVVVAIAAIALIAGLFWGIPWFREWRFVRQQGSGFRAGAGESPQELRAKFVSAIGKLKSLPQASGNGDGLYSLPWYLMLGPAESGKTAAIVASELFSPLTASSAGTATQNFDCWVSNTMIVVNTASRYAVPADAAKDRAEWYRLVRLIRYYHGREPLSGLIVAIPANQLLSESEDKLRELGGKLRERIEESINQLGVDLPVYVLVTKVDLLEGFQEFVGLLPQRVMGEAVGYVDPAAGRRGPEALGRFEAGVHSVYERLNFLRSSILNGNTAEELRRSIFCFPEEFRALEAPLRGFIEPLVNEDVRYHTPLFRGIFFASSRSQGAPVSSLRKQLEIAALPPSDGKPGRACFLNDLFSLVLPRDRALAGPPTRRAKA